MLENRNRGLEEHKWRQNLSINSNTKMRGIPSLTKMPELNNDLKNLEVSTTQHRHVCQRMTRRPGTMLWNEASQRETPITL